MPRKKSGKKAAQTFDAKLDQIQRSLVEINASNLSDQTRTWAYEAAIIKTAVAFEHLMLECIVTAINNDTSTVSASTGVAFPKHLTDEVCEFLVTAGGYFDFRGRSGLTQKIRGFVPPNHWLLTVVKKQAYKDPLDRIVALRNFAAHESEASKKVVLNALGLQKISSAGAWAKRQRRLERLVAQLRKMGSDIEASAPY